MCLSMSLNVDNVGAKRMSSGRLSQATGPATENGRCRVVALFWVRLYMCLFIYLYAYRRSQIFSSIYRLANICVQKVYVQY